MFFWIIQQIFISLLLIISIHYIYIFFKNNLTIPKTKDLVKKPLERYRKIYTSINNKPKESKETMKNDLKSYLKQLTKKNTNTEQKSSTIQNAGGLFNSSNFTTF